MSKQITVLAGQTITDIAIQYVGSEDAVAQIMELNDLSITSILSAGQVLTVPDVQDGRVESYFTAGGYEPAAGDLGEEAGLEYWRLEIDFIIS